MIAKSIRVSSLYQRVWPSALLVLGLGITAAWTTFLGYKFVELFITVLLGVKEHFN
jgi:hypothetical protein